MSMLRIIKVLGAVMLFIVPLQLESQEKTYSAKEALSIFKGGDYVEAERAYASLLKRYDRESRYNYYYGICLLQNNNNIPQAIKRLKYAAAKGVSRDAFYYLGRAYQLSYRFDDAISQYNRFLKYASASDIRNEKALAYRDECEAGRLLVAKIYHLEVHQRDTVSEGALLKAYHPAKDVGRIVYNSEFFESGLDPKGILYRTERGDEVYFTMTNEQEGDNLYRIDKLLDGWSERQSLKGVNTASNERYPYVLIDGYTLFFSSDRAGGMGGFDLYKAIYDSESKTFSDPVNLGVPFNSPMDDYLFVADQFNSVAWFASNREMNDSTFIVYNIRWDDTVVKSLVQDMNEVQEVAALRLSDKHQSPSSKSGGVSSGNEDSQKKDLFYFSVADTLEYGQYEDFKSMEAKAIFTNALNLVHQKDSLSERMAAKREMYARTYSETQQSLLVDQIITLEKQVYGLDEKIERSFYQARSLEQAKVRQLVKEGRYSSSSQVRVERVDNDAYDDILIPKNFTFYTEQGFAQKLKKLEKMYVSNFDAGDIKELRHADSLFVWGNILTLESSKILEAANNQPEGSASLLNVAFRQKDTSEEESHVASQVQLAKELKLTALKLYHESLDRKFKVYDAKMQGILHSNSVSDFAYLEESLGGGKEYFRKAIELIDPRQGFDMERYERSGTIKRAGVQVQEEGLFKYAENGGHGNNAIVEVTTAKVPKTYQELQQGTVPIEPAKIVKDAFVKPATPSLVFKIQIGVFRNKPNDIAVSQIPPISSIEIPERDLTKYYAGKYASYSDAKKDLPRVKEAGFDGAFIVVFKAGTQIKLSEDLKQ